MKVFPYITTMVVYGETSIKINVCPPRENNDMKVENYTTGNLDFSDCTLLMLHSTPSPHECLETEPDLMNWLEN